MKPKIAIASIIHGDKTAPGTNYSHAIDAFGGMPVFLCTVTPREAPFVLSQFDGLLLAGGADSDPKFFGQEKHPRTELVPPARDETELFLARLFCASKKPVLGICRGVQVLNIAMGGDLIQHIDDLGGDVTHGDVQRHPVYLKPATLLARLYPDTPTLSVNSTHHQSLGKIAPGFTVSATASDGIIEAIERGPRVLGLQWHPERMLREAMGPIFRWFIDAASQKE